MRRATEHDEERVHRGAERRRAAAGGRRHPGGRELPKLGISEPTLYRWRRKFARMGITEIRRLKQLAEENRRLKQVVADLTVDKAYAAGPRPPRVVAPTCRRNVVTQLQAAYQVSEPCACGLTGFSRSTQRYRSRAAPQDELRSRLKELAQARIRYGSGGLHVLLQREELDGQRKAYLSALQR